jgi:hypothetical protein
MQSVAIKQGALMSDAVTNKQHVATDPAATWKKWQ